MRQWRAVLREGGIGARQPEHAGLHRQEARVRAALEPLITSRQLPIPRLNGIVDRPPGIALVLQDIDDRQAQLPWQITSSRSGGAASPHAVTALVCALAGYLTESSLRPPPPGLATIRAFQAVHATIARQWLTERL